MEQDSRIAWDYRDLNFPYWTERDFERNVASIGNAHITLTFSPSERPPRDEIEQLTERIDDLRWTWHEFNTRMPTNKTLNPFERHVYALEEHLAPLLGKTTIKEAYIASYLYGHFYVHGLRTGEYVQNNLIVSDDPIHGSVDRLIGALDMGIPVLERSFEHLRELAEEVRPIDSFTIG